MTDLPVVELRITPEDYEALKNCNAIVVGEWERTDDKYRWGEFLMCGTHEECEDFASTPELKIVPNGFTCIGKQVVPVADLLPPKEQKP